MEGEAALDFLSSKGGTSTTGCRGEGWGWITTRWASEFGAWSLLGLGHAARERGRRAPVVMMRDSLPLDPAVQAGSVGESLGLPWQDLSFVLSLCEYPHSEVQPPAENPS